MLVVMGLRRETATIGWLPVYRPVGASDAGLRLSSAIRPTVTHLTMMSLKVNWPLFQCDDNANWVAKHNTERLLCPAKGEEGEQIKWPYNGGCQERQMLLCAQDCIDISLACQAQALEESYSAGDQMVPHRVPRIKQLNKAGWLLKKNTTWPQEMWWLVNKESRASLSIWLPCARADCRLMKDPLANKHRVYLEEGLWSACFLPTPTTCPDTGHSQDALNSRISLDRQRSLLQKKTGGVMFNYTVGGSFFWQ